MTGMFCQCLFFEMFLIILTLYLFSMYCVRVIGCEAK